MHVVPFWANFEKNRLQTDGDAITQKSLPGTHQTGSFSYSQEFSAPNSLIHSITHSLNFTLPNRLLQISDEVFYVFDAYAQTY